MYYYKIEKVQKGSRARYTTVEKVDLIVHDYFAYEITPNPFNNVLNVTIHSKENEDIHFTAMDMTGKFIDLGSFSVASGTSNLVIKTDHLENGMYIIQYKTHDGVIHRKKLVKE